MTDAILPEEKKVTLAGQEYKVRQLSLSSVFRLSNVIKKVIEEIPAAELLSMDSSAAGLMVLVQGIPVAEEECYAIFGQVLGIEAAQARDLPATGLIQVVKAVIKQEDMDSLFFDLKSLAEKISAGRSKTEETPSPE